MRFAIPVLFTLLAFCAQLAFAAEPQATASAPATTSAPATRYTFSWPLGQADAPAPRGGTTRGAPVTLDTEPSGAWRDLQAPNLSAFERDRRAILAMAGDYRVSFDFLEVETFKVGTTRDRPYQSWGTEKVYVDADTGTFISLVHILAMRVVQDDGSLSEPMVTKHWRQDWRYEPKELVQYQGRERWERRRLARRERSGVWSQTVYQVDESPRYASIGVWQHSPSFSAWTSAETWRPLPRREWSVRKDYQVLIGTNRHTVTASGWLQEENNLKTALTDARGIDVSQPYAAREYGVARYARMRDGDFAAADQYYQRTREFWNEVRVAWADLFRENQAVTLRAPVDQAGLFRKMFAYADELASGNAPATPADQVIAASMREMGAPMQPGPG